MIKILFLAANPSDTARLRLDEEARAIDAAIRQGEYRNHFGIRSHWAVRISDLQELLLRHQPHIVHFCGHGSSAGELILQDDQGNAVTVSGEAIRKLFAVLKDNIQCVVLSACYSDAQAHSIAQHIDCVVGMGDTISDQAALDFATAFYRALGYGRSVQTAFELGTNEIDLHGLMEQDKPKLIANTVEPAKVFFAVDDVQPKSAVRRTPKLMAPNPPADFVARPTKYSALRDLLLADGNAPVGITAAIRGAGGYGKTTLAQALCHDPAIIEHFPDGIFWVELAQEPGELTGRVLNLVENLIDRRPGSTTLDAATGELIKALDDKKLLLVIDDVWQAAHIEPFLQGGPYCTRLITTRINSVLPPEAVRVNVDAMQSSEATQLLGAGIRNVGDALDKLAKRLGEWPLLLRIMNAVLRERIGFGQDLKETIADVDQELSEEGLGAFQNTASPSERHVSVTATLSVSLRRLPELDRERYHHLAIFPEDVDIPLITVAQLWGVSPREAKKLCFRLADLSLLLRFDLVTNSIRLHDVIRTYLRQAQPNLAELHRSFLDSYKLADWTALPNEEPYLWNRLSYHLIEAGRTEELTALFADDRWLQIRVAHDNYLYDGYLADLDQSWQQVHTRVLRQLEGGEAPTVVALSVHHALIRCSVNSLSSNYEPHLVARAVATGLWASARALSIAYKIPDNQERTAMITAILNTHQCNQPQCVVAKIAALQAALGIRDEWSQADALAGLAPHLSDDLLLQTLQAALAIRDERSQARALAELAPHLSDDLLPQALQATLAIRDVVSQARALAGLAPHLSDDLLPQALQATLAIRDEWSQADALAGLAPHLSDDLLPQALQAALDIKNEGYQARALAGLAPYLSDDLLPRALQATLAIRDEGYQASALTGLAPYLSEEKRAETLTQALQAALGIKDERSQADALAGLAPHLSDDLLPQALQATLAIRDERSQADALAGLAPHLSDDLLPQTLQAALGIKDVVSQARALAGLAPYLSDDLLLQALQATLAIRDEEYQADALARLAPYLSEEKRAETLPRALQATLAIRDEWSQADALARLAPQLSDDLLPQALQATLAIKDVVSQAYALAGLASHLSDDLLPQVFQAALASRDVVSQAYALAGLARYLPEQQRAETVSRALQAALASRNERYQADALAGLAPYLSDDLLPKALRAALAIRSERYQADALAGLAPYLSDDLLPKAIQAALAIWDEWSQAETLARLAPHLPEKKRAETLPRALQAALDIMDEGYQARSLARLAPHLSDDLRPRALQAALKIKNEGYQADALAAFLSSSNFSNLLHTIRKAIANHLWKNLPVQQRQDILRFLAAESSFKPPVIDQNTLATIARSISEICFEWRWL